MSAMRMVLADEVSPKDRGWRKLANTRLTTRTYRDLRTMHQSTPESDTGTGVRTTHL
jgi:hypothetical protein